MGNDKFGDFKSMRNDSQEKIKHEIPKEIASRAKSPSIQKKKIERKTLRERIEE